MLNPQPPAPEWGWLHAIQDVPGSWGHTQLSPEQEFFLGHLPELSLYSGHGWHVVGGSFYTDHLGGCSQLCGPSLCE